MPPEQQYSRANADPEIPPQLLSNLVDEYFAHGFYANLLFYPQQFRDDLAQGKVNRHVILGICALASISYVDASGRNYLVDDGFSYTWADQASLLVLSEQMSPSENTLVSLINLTLFWYCQGHWKRSFVLGLNCIGVIRVLGLEDLVSNNETSLTAEISRRRLWGALILSITSGRDDILTMTGPVMQALPLPCDDDAFAKGEVSLPLLTMRDNGRSPSFFAEFIRIFNIW